MLAVIIDMVIKRKKLHSCCNIFPAFETGCLSAPSWMVAKEKYQRLWRNVNSSLVVREGDEEGKEEVEKDVLGGEVGILRPKNDAKVRMRE